MSTTWTDISAAAFNGDYNGYIRYANQVLNVSGAATESSTNGMRIFNIEENTHYRVTMQMRNRFRLGCAANMTYGQTLTNYIFDALDANDSTDQGGLSRTLEITSGSGQVLLFVGAWSSGASDTIFNTLNTIVLEEAQTAYTVTFKDWDGAVLKTQQVQEGYAATAPTDPTREGYTFTGWDVPFSNITADTIVTALYQELSSSYTVTFRDYDGTLLLTQTVEYGEAAVPPLPPMRSGYIFDHWSRDFSCVTEDMTVIAVYRAALEHTLITIYDSAYTLIQTVEKVLSANLREALDGELTFDFTTLADRVTDITVGNIVEYDSCYFNIVRVVKSISSGVMIVSVTGEHISYVLNDDSYKLESFDFTGAPAAGLALLLSGTPFSAGTVDFSDEVTMQINTTVTRREALMQFIAILSGEIEYSGQSINIRQHRGSTAVRELMESKNVTDVSVTHDSRSATASYSVAFHRMADFSIGDEVHIVFSPLGVDTYTRIISLEYNPFYRYSIRVEVGSYVPSINDNLFRIEQTAITQDADMTEIWGAFDSFESDYADFQVDYDNFLSSQREVKNISVGTTQFTVTFTDNSTAVYNYTVDSEGRMTSISKVVS